MFVLRHVIDPSQSVDPMSLTSHEHAPYPIIHDVADASSQVPRGATPTALDLTCLASKRSPRRAGAPAARPICTWATPVQRVRSPGPGP